MLFRSQQGGDPSPFDRIQATRLARLCLEYLIKACDQESNNCAFIGLQKGQFNFHDMRDFERMIDPLNERPKDEWWLESKGMASLMAKFSPDE